MSRAGSFAYSAEPNPSPSIALWAEPNRALGSDKKLGRVRARAEHGILPEFAINYGNNHLNLVSTLLHLVTNPLLLGNKTQKPGNDFPTLQVARCLKNTQSLFCCEFYTELPNSYLMLKFQVVYDILRLTYLKRAIFAP